MSAGLFIDAKVAIVPGCVVRRWRIMHSQSVPVHDYCLTALKVSYATARRFKHRHTFMPKFPTFLPLYEMPSMPFISFAHVAGPNWGA